MVMKILKSKSGENLNQTGYEICFDNTSLVARCPTSIQKYVNELSRQTRIVIPSYKFRRDGFGCPLLVFVSGHNEFYAAC